MTTPNLFKKESNHVHFAKRSSSMDLKRNSVKDVAPLNSSSPKGKQSAIIAMDDISLSDEPNRSPGHKTVKVKSSVDIMPIRHHVPRNTSLPIDQIELFAKEAAELREESLQRRHNDKIPQSAEYSIIMEAFDKNYTV